MAFSGWFRQVPPPRRTWTFVANQSGTRDSNPRHPAWEAGTLPTELVPQSDRVRNAEARRRQPRAASPAIGGVAARAGGGAAAQKETAWVVMTQAVPVCGAVGSALASVASALIPGACNRRVTARWYVHAMARSARDAHARLRRLLRMRAITFMHLLFPPPAYRRRGACASDPADRTAASRDVSLGVFLRIDPRVSAMLAEVSPRRISPGVCPDIAWFEKSNTPIRVVRGWAALGWRSDR